MGEYNCEYELQNGCLFGMEVQCINNVQCMYMYMYMTEIACMCRCTADPALKPQFNVELETNSTTHCTCTLY